MNIKLFLAKLFNKKWAMTFDYGWGSGNEWIFDINDWGRKNSGKFRGWIKRKDTWGGIKYIDKIRIKYYNWALTPKEILNSYKLNERK